MPRTKIKKSNYEPGEVISCVQINAQCQMSLRDDVRKYLDIDIGDWITVIQGAEEGVVVFEKYKGEYVDDQKET